MTYEIPRGTRIYFAQCDFGGPIKIGHSLNRQSRISTLSYSLPFTLVEIGSVQGGLFGERFIQCWFRRHQVKGEWFAPVPELWRWALQARTKGSIAEIPQAPSKGYAASSDTLRMVISQHRISLEQVAVFADLDPNYLAFRLKSPGMSSRTILAAFAVALVKAGHYPDLDMWTYFQKPELNEAA